MSCRKREIVKVVHIHTRYVEADAKSFKAVVQKLTGKDSCIDQWRKESSSAGAKKEISSTTRDQNKLFEDVYNIAYDDPSGRDNNNSNGVSMLSKGMSFKDLDGLILELPSLEEFQWLYNHRIDVE